MNDVIRFLDTLGASAPLPPAAMAAAIDALDIGDAQRHALHAGDAPALGGLLGGRTQMWCAIFEPKREPDQQPDQDRPDEPGEGESDDAER